MTSKEIRIGLSSGLEARPAAMLVQVASQYESSIYVESEEKRVNAKSIIQISDRFSERDRERNSYTKQEL